MTQTVCNCDFFFFRISFSDQTMEWHCLEIDSTKILSETLKFIIKCINNIFVIYCFKL